MTELPVKTQQNSPLFSCVHHEIMCESCKDNRIYVLHIYNYSKLCSAISRVLRVFLSLLVSPIFCDSFLLFASVLNFFSTCSVRWSLFFWLFSFLNYLCFLSICFRPF